MRRGVRAHAACLRRRLLLLRSQYSLLRCTISASARLRLAAGAAAICARRSLGDRCRLRPRAGDCDSSGICGVLRLGGGSAAASARPACRRRRRSAPPCCATSSAVGRAGRSPASPSGSVKSQCVLREPDEVADRGIGRPTRGEAPHGVSSAGTPGCRKARMSVSAVIDSSDGSCARSNAGFARLRSASASAARQSRCGALARRVGGSASCASTCSARVCVRASRLRRDQRARKFSGSLIVVVLRRAGRAAPALPDRRGRACA